MNKRAADRGQTAPYVPALTAATNLAISAIGQLHLAQIAGLDRISADAGKYRKQLEKTASSIWADLAIWALSAATAGIAAKVAEKIPGLFAKATTKIHWVHNADDEVGALLLSSPAKVSVFITDSVKEGIKLKGKDVIATSLSANANDEKTPGVSQGGENSSSASTDFFGKQTTAINLQKGANERVVTEQQLSLNLHVTEHPVTQQAAVGAMTAVQQAFEEAGKGAETLQAAATAPQWTALVSRVNLGSELVTSSKGTVSGAVASKTEQLRTGAEDKPKAVDGVLDVYLDAVNPPTKSSRARMHGVSQHIVKRLESLPLVDQPIVVRLQIGRGERPTIVTRDEVGRLHVTGDYHGIAKWSLSSSQRGTEADAIAGAKALIDTVLSEPLGIQIEHDDTSDKSGTK